METERETKARLREWMKRRRDAIPEAERAAKSAAIAKRLTEMEWYASGTDILVYAAIRSEVDLGAFCDMAWRDGKALYFPRVCGNDMDFYRADARSQFAPGCFCVPEPTRRSDVFAGISQNAGNRQSVPVLVPGIAFSRQGARIGYGKGYYDRYLAGHPELMPIGICFQEQLVDAIETEKQDYLMCQIVTEDVSS